ncbi:MAG TPA: hypothetical protein VE174_05885 [Actinomycetota bacterium]|nr:hypothetical protein [Actinomycetota bacterium]
MKMRIRSIGMSLAAALVAVTLVGAPSTAVSAPGCAMETVSLKTFKLEIKAKKKLYKVGETAQVLVNVTRPAEEDPLGNGIPFERPMTEPAPDINVGIGLRVGDVFLFGHSMTDANGDAVVKVKLEPWTPAGNAIADAFAWNVVQDTPCLRIEENGYTQAPNLFRVIK